MFPSVFPCTRRCTRTLTSSVSYSFPHPVRHTGPQVQPAFDRSHISAPTDLQGLFHCRVMKCVVLFLHWQTVGVMVTNHCFLHLIRSSTSPYIHITLSHSCSSCNLSLAERWQTPSEARQRGVEDLLQIRQPRRTNGKHRLYFWCGKSVTHTLGTKQRLQVQPIILSPFILSTTVRDYVHCLYIIYTKIIYTLLSICVSILCC